MAIDTLGANALASNSVTTAKIVDDAVTSAKIPAGAVVASDVADGSISTAKLADDAVTSAKLDTNIAVGGTLVNTGLITASAGVAIGGTGAANTLDDYEEGTWTPSFGGNTTYHNQSGKYTKIGRTVYVSGIIQANVLGTGSTTTVSGFPFATNNAGGGYATGDVGFHYFLAVNVFNIKLLMGNNTTVTGFQAKTSGSGTSSSALAVFGNGARVDFTVVYDVS